MKSLRLHQCINDTQYPVIKDDQNMTERTFVANLIRENAKPSSSGYSLDVSDLELIDQKLLLSYCVAADTYEWACQNPIRLAEVIKEYETDMQRCIDDIIDDVYYEDMEEMGAVLCHHKDNNEPFWDIK